jgi:phosphoribosylglycinamide formyltransferase-1
VSLPRIVVLASGNGSNLQALVDAASEGRISGRIAAVISDRPESGALARAASAFVPAVTLPPDTGEARFRIINLHPALPGELPGTGAIERAWDEFLSGARTRSGVMVHEVPDAAVDAGPVLAYEEVAFEAGDDLDAFARRIHTVEHRLLVEVVADICAALRTDYPQNDSQEVIDVRTG